MELQITSKEIEYFRQKIQLSSVEYYSDFPWRSTGNMWHALVAEVMLQRTKAEQVEPVYRAFSKLYPAPEDYLNDEGAHVFESLGLHWREKQLEKLANEISENGIPVNKEDLMNMAGIGSYIAAAFRSLHLGRRDVIIDSNVVRIYGRFFGFETDGETRRKGWFIDLADQLTPPRNFKKYNYGLIDFTRMICKPDPACNSCQLYRKCKYGHKTSTSQSVNGSFF